MVGAEPARKGRVSLLLLEQAERLNASSANALFSRLGEPVDNVCSLPLESQCQLAPADYLSGPSPHLEAPDPWLRRTGKPMASCPFMLDSGGFQRETVLAGQRL